MKISIWQQFSSNHSAYFEVIGEFESVEKATEASNELKAILNEIREWWEGYFDNPASYDWQAPEHGESPILTPVEEKLRDKYEVDWQFSLNWYRWGTWKHKVHPIKQLNNLVFVKSPHPYLHKGPQPFNELLEKFGAKVAIDADVSLSHPDTWIVMDVNCQLPEDKEVANSIYEGFKNDFKNMYLPGELTYMYEPFFELNDEMSDKQFEGDIRIYEVETVDDRLYLYGIRPYFDEWIGIIPEFREFLESKGCTDIQFTFHSARLSKQDGENE